MTQHETQQDVTNQQAVMKIVTEWFQRLPCIGDNGEGFHHVEIPTVANHSTPDFSLYWNHLRIGVVEIKCRNRDYDTWMIDRTKMMTLYKDYFKKGIMAAIAFAHVEDGTIHQIYLADIRNLIACKDTWGKASDEMMGTTNHGKDKRKESDEGFLLPRALFWKLM